MNGTMKQKTSAVLARRSVRATRSANVVPMRTEIRVPPAAVVRLRSVASHVDLACITSASTDRSNLPPGASPSRRSRPIGRTARANTKAPTTRRSHTSAPNAHGVRGPVRMTSSVALGERCMSAPVSCPMPADAPRSGSPRPLSRGRPSRGGPGARRADYSAPTGSGASGVNVVHAPDSRRASPAPGRLRRVRPGTKRPAPSSRGRGRRGDDGRSRGGRRGGYWLNISVNFLRLASASDSALAASNAMIRIRSRGGNPGGGAISGCAAR